MQDSHSQVWGPPFWFFLHTISLHYPHNPNAIVKKKYYEFMQMFPMFIPDEKMAKRFENLLTEYPVQPYLDNRDSFVRWMHFIHNKINQHLEKPKITLASFYESYYALFKPKIETWIEQKNIRKKIIYIVTIVFLAFISYYFSRQK
jgi:hypothetical protein